MVFALYHYVSKLPQSIYRVVANSGKFPYTIQSERLHPFPCHVNCETH